MVLHTQASYGIGHTITGKYWLDLRPDDVHWNVSDTGWAKAAWSSYFAPWIQGATIFVEGHDLLGARVRYRHASEPAWRDVSMDALGNDRWSACFVVETLGRYEVTVEAWIDRFASWRHGFARKVEAGQDVTTELLEGAVLVRAAGTHAGDGDRDRLVERAAFLGGPAEPKRAEAASRPNSRR
jgi:hypothetical protein